MAQALSLFHQEFRAQPCEEESSSAYLLHERDFWRVEMGLVSFSLFFFPFACE